ncbi:MAG TPA: MgtC/SapB family protein [Casimicrobiaceae bacterium]
MRESTRNALPPIAVSNRKAMPNLEWIEVAARLGSAVLAGAILGVNRDLHRKPAGLRTHALVCLGSAVVFVIVTSLQGAGADAVARVIQGVVTGVGFIGAGVILHHDAEHRVEGLTTAASIWIAAALGVACGSGYWITVLLALALTLGVLVFGGPIERAFERWLRPEKVTGSKDSDS